MTYRACSDIPQPHCKYTSSVPWNAPWRTYISALLCLSDISIASHHRPMTHRPSESNWKPPPIDQILCSLDGIYASGVFWRVVSPQLLDCQSRLMSAIASMTEKLKTALHPRDLSPPESRPRKYALHFDRKSVSFILAHRFFAPSPSPQEEHDSLAIRHRRERRLYTEAVKRVQKGSILTLEPTTANILRVYNQLTASLDFWEDAKSWYGMPWWGKPRLDFPWAPPRPLSQTLCRDPPGRSLSSTSSDPQRAVTFCEDEKDSSPKAPALTRVPRCSPAANSELAALRAFRPLTKLISV